MRHARIIFERLLNQLKRRSKSEHSFDRSRWSDLHVVVSRLRNVAIGWQISKTTRHLRESPVRLKKTPRNRVDKSDAARHVRENFFVKDNFPLDPPRRLGLAPVKPAGERGENGGERDQPERQDKHSPEKIVHRFVGNGFGLYHHRHPTG